MPRLPVIALCLVLPFSIFSQEKTDDTRWTTRLDLMVPQPLANKAFKVSFTGILDVGLSINRRIGNKFNLGVSYRYKQFQVRTNKIPDLQILPIFHGHNGNLRFSMDLKNGKSGLITPGLNVGYNLINYSHLPCVSLMPTHEEVTGFNLEPNLAYVWLIDEGFGMGLMLSYNLLTYEFDPEGICLTEYKDYSDKQKTGLTQSFSIGFSVFIDFAHQAEGFEE